MFLRVEPKARAFDAPSSFLSSCMAACIHSLAKRSNRDRNSRDCSCPRQPDVVAHKMLKVRVGHHGHATRREPESSSRSARRPETTRHLLVDSTVVVAPLPSSFSLIVQAVRRPSSLTFAAAGRARGHFSCSRAPARSWTWPTWAGKRRSFSAPPITAPRPASPLIPEPQATRRSPLVWRHQKCGRGRKASSRGGPRKELGVAPSGQGTRREFLLSF
jgi:hypothetical protein